MAASVRLAVEADGFPAEWDEPWFAGLATAVLASVPGTPHDIAVSLAVVDDETIRALNASYRDVDAPTDVLSFNLQEGEPFPGDEAAASFLGEVVISYPTALRQAAAHGREGRYEVAHLFIHGLLHLRGYDHERPDEEAAMREREDAALTAVFGRADRRGWEH